MSGKEIRKRKLYDFFDKKYEISEVLDFYTKEKTEKIYDGNKVKMYSQRYETFKYKGCTCVECGRIGTHFKLQRGLRTKKNMNQSDRYHFGLWSDDDVQLTKDHIIPKSIGGKDSLENYQTMCSKCNEKKGNECTILDIENGSHKNGTSPKPQDKKNYSVKYTEKEVDIFMKELRLKYNELGYNKKILSEYVLEYKRNPYNEEVKDENILKAVEYCTNFYLEIIKWHKGEISKSNHLLKGFPKKIKAKYLILEKEKHNM